VIAILAILSAIGVSNFQSARIKARDVSRKSDLQTVSKSLEAYVNDHRAYPLSSSDGEIICKSDNSSCEWGSEFSDTTGTIYAATLPQDSSGASYRYSSNGSSYTLYAFLENENDPAVVDIEPAVACGAASCNYKITSSNIQ
jgi:type II secretory pathway pseudopilin PulG